MSGETERDPSGWTPDLLDRHLTQRIDAERQISRERFGFIVATGAIIVAEIYRRLTGLNHENARVSAAAEKSVSVEKYDEAQKRVDDDRRKNEERLTAIEARASTTATRSETQAETRSEQGRAMTERGTLRRNQVALFVTLAAFALAVLGYVAGQRGKADPAVPPATVTVTTTAP